MQLMNSYGEYYTELTEKEKLDAIKKYGSIDSAAYHLGVAIETIRCKLRVRDYGKYLRKPPVITAEFNHYVMRPW